eukprot:TRINITY_DN12675_c0_g1_i1.p1 TRINITY_DN12675_c0_g1~~TRINITY_DN12675_c0_g1_i1.p1  ORF type:complete len:925 (+),score=208.56 TRINITY_DN12675_c0_g1_i1:81-2777(+)
MVLPGAPPSQGDAVGRPGRQSSKDEPSRNGANPATPTRGSIRTSQVGAGGAQQPQARQTGITGVKAYLARTSWYTNPTAVRIRTFLNGKFWALLMVVALLLALFLPDIFTLAGVADSTFSDIVLTAVMVGFVIEFILLTAVDVPYLFSFFQLMDVFGTVSMIFDISYMLAEPADRAQLASNNSGATGNLMLLRAARAAKVGARAGRLSRVLRFLRFLPFLAGGDKPDENKTGIASMISGQLANLVAIRVAGLTIILVMVIPLFDIWTFPQTDFSLQTWVNRLSTNMEEGRLQDTLTELDMLKDFYQQHAYGPYLACLGTATEDAQGVNSFECSNDKDSINVREIDSWDPGRAGPPRLSSSLKVHTSTFMVQFNMHSTKQVEAALSIATMIFIIIIMVFSGLALSSVVTELAVRPLERMLETVRKIASTVFKFSAEVVEEEDKQDDITAADIDYSNEMKLLEKVVQKLAIIADLQTSKQVPEKTEGMRDEDIGILSMMHGTNIVEEKAKNEVRKSMAAPRAKRGAYAPTVRLEDFGVTQEVFNSWGFNALSLSKTQRMSVAIFSISKFHEVGDGFITTPDEVALLQRFVSAVEKEYLPVPFHSFAHAVDVVHAVSRIMRLIPSNNFLSELEEFALLIAAIGHDIGHPGVNNGFLSEVGHELALQYNDRSPLENMHCAKLYTITGRPETNVFRGLSKEQYKEVRKHCIETILHTDMMAHQAMVKDLQMLFQMNSEVFSSTQEAASNPLSFHAEIEIFSSPENKTKVMDTILHSADVSNPCKAWDTTHAWALVCLEEFFAQGDQEKEMGIPVQFLNDRDKLNKPNSQIGFIEFMIAPFYVAQIRLWPSMRELGENMATNLANWEDMWEKDVNPGDEEKQKVKARVDKVQQNVQDAIERKPV